MLRITQDLHGSPRPALILEGNLVGPWVEELRRAAAALALGVSDDARAILDLRGLHFADSDGVALLRQLRESGMEFAAASTFITSLMGVRE